MHDNYFNPRLDHTDNDQTLASGVVRLDRVKIMWLGIITISGTIGSALTFSWGALLLFTLFTGLVLLLGHSLGMHRLFIHKAYSAPRWLQLTLIHLGTIVGICGPLSMLRTHDTRDWAQRQASCHPYFSHAKPWWHDIGWQLFCRLDFDQPLQFKIEQSIQNDRAIAWMEKTWMLQQLPWAILFYYLGGWGFVFWGISSRVLISNLGHWFIGYLAHNEGHQSWRVDGACVQGHNISWSSLLTMGECWHNNHHAFPYSAKFGLYPGQWDPGWWTLLALKKIGLVNKLIIADTTDLRNELVEL